jgi:1-acyl-sn-glycerol-3-phosphate acyltransferase
VQPEHDPFLLVMNHSQRPEAIMLPVVLITMRRGKTIHFIGDWNFQMIPGVAFLYRRSGLITVAKKPAKPRFLNAFKRFYGHPLSASERALLALRSGGSLGIFPEGTVNRDPERLLAGRPGAARLSIEAQVPVVPGGIRFPRKSPGERIMDGDKMTLQIGAPMMPPPDDGSREVVASWHHRIMQAISELSGKRWEPPREGS